MQETLAAPITELKMFNDTIYAYEFALATMELSSLAGLPDGVLPSGLLDGLIKLRVEPRRLEAMKERLAYFEQVGGQYTYQKYLTEVQGAVKSTHATAYMTHWIYPYKAKFHPQMVRALLNIVGAKKGDVILDPMCGSGTTNVEAKLMGIDSIGTDILPIGVLATKVKCEMLEPKVAEKILSFPMIEAGTELLGGANEIPEIYQIEDKQIRDFYTLLHFESLSISRLPKRTFPAVWKKLQGFYLSTVRDSLAVTKKLGIDRNLGKEMISVGDARDQRGIEDRSVNHIIVSPPYAIAIDYVVRNTDQLTRMGHSTKQLYSETIGLRGKGDSRIANYYEDLEKAIDEMYRVLKPGGRCVIVIGDTQYDKNTLPTINRAIEFAEDVKKAGFRLLHNVPKVSAGRFGLFRTERILIFEK